MNLQTRIEELYARTTAEYGEECFQAFDELKAALNEGTVRAAEPDPTSSTGWKVNTWVKKGILLGFRIGRVVEMPIWRPGAGMGPAVAGSSWPPHLDRQDTVAEMPCQKIGGQRPPLQKCRNVRLRTLRHKASSATSTPIR